MTQTGMLDVYGSVLDGEVVHGVDEWFTTYDPGTGQQLARVQRGGSAEVDLAVQSAEAAWYKWRALPGVERGRIMLRVATALQENAQELARIESLDNGKPLSGALMDIAVAARYFEYYAGMADKLQGETIPIGDKHHSYTRLEPYGVTAHIVPWNAALQQAARSVAPALAAGNTAVVKPAEDTSLACVHFALIAAEAGLPPGVMNLVTGLGHEAGAALVAHPKVRRITFTGSVPTGQEVMRQAAVNLSPVTLELGGKSPNIVFGDADLEAAAAGAAMAINVNAGQVCAAGSRLLVQRSVHDELVERLVAIQQEVRLGHGLDNPDMGPITTSAQFAKVKDYLRLGVSEGASVALGGDLPLNAELHRGQFVRPTIFTGVDNSMRIAQEEIFGPVLCVIPFNTEEDAIRIANDTKYGLTAGVWTNDLGRAHRVAASIDAGQVSVNDYFAGGIQAPFGGFKESGFGREKGVEAIYHYLQTKTVSMKIA
ncbi:aldehyde dehydrogenase family protein [Microbacterium sp.]|uniref:aldehyde dehydrogenase family protein n=1 Tax=Microbacterium sp. TaxID=51671 RepID=UPI003A8D4B34